MIALSFFDRVIGQAFTAFSELHSDQRIAALRSAIPDLHFFFDEGRPLAGREAPARTRALAGSLESALRAEAADDPAASTASASVRERLITDAFLRGEADRDQNVYLGQAVHPAPHARRAGSSSSSRCEPGRGGLRPALGRAPSRCR
jgi:hypothetical protein